MATVVVRWASTRVPPATSALLSDDERSRWRSFRQSGDRDRFLAAHVLARVAVSAATESAPGDVELLQRCERCGGAHGRPVAAVAGRPGPSVSFSHAGSVVVAAVAAVGVGVGVDVEPRRQPAPVLEAIAELLPGTPRRDLVARWVAVEAAAKATGTGLELPPQQVSFRGIRLIELELAPGYMGALAVATRLRPVVDLARVRWSSFRAGPAAPAPTATDRTGR